MFLTPTLLQQDPGAQTATVASTVNAGDVLHTTINGGEEIPAYTVPAGQTAAQVADGDRRPSINGTPRRPDPVSGQPLGQRFLAVQPTAPTGSSRSRPASRWTCSVSAGASETYTARRRHAAVAAARRWRAR